MQYFKLQLGCLAIVLFTTFLYIRKTTKVNFKCNPFYDALLYICPWAIFFDGFTSWTVNHMDVVAPWLNQTGHILFMVLMDLVIIVTFFYMLNATIGIEHFKKFAPILAIPGVVSLVGILVFFPQVEYIHGVTTNYSMGLSAYFCYGSLAFHSMLILIMLIAHYRSIEKVKRIGVTLSLAISIVILIVQCIFPESLVSSLLPTFIIVGFYLSLEDPASRRLEVYNQAMVMDFATLVESRDDSTGGHIKRTRLYVEALLKEMSKVPDYRHVLTRDYVTDICDAAPMHDIGKISTPDHILQKPGKLTDEEYAIMKEHAARGGEIIVKTFSDLNEPEFEKIAYEVARYHHEKWNGKGYPEGLSGEDIPLHARIMAIADVFDAVSAKRCYRDELPLDVCFKIIEDGIGTDFDPALAKLFLGAREKISRIHDENRS